MTPRDSQAFGRAFEELIELQNNIYLRQGRAALYHNHVAGRFVNQGVFIPDPGKARPDFSGTLREGRSIHFDIKSMGDTCGWRLDPHQIHQYEMLLAQALMGAITFFLVEFRASETICLLRVHPKIPVEDNRPKIMFADVPIADWRLQKKADNRFQHRADTVPAFCIPRNADGLYDWLEAVEIFWLGKAPIAKKSVGRPASTSLREKTYTPRKG